ncbi:MAG: hypothetical protein J6N21_17790 [Butyrivibrio sp.]|nr:hypothetical protein [Butyrivibrio sp.]MBP3198836.1 hypothetical protein [Butyrivibrio sp.]
MKVYDKAAWHIDGNENAVEVVDRFRAIYSFLDSKKMLSEDGKEILELGIDSSISLNSSMVNSEGKAFLDAKYDVITNQDPKKIKDNLIGEYKDYLKNLEKK